VLVILLFPLPLPLRFLGSGPKLELEAGKGAQKEGIPRGAGYYSSTVQARPANGGGVRSY
jgi:hypothetical protein